MEKHGEAKRGKLTQLYNSWRGMRDRCSHPSHNHYKDYGGRGICVCKEWDESFACFRDWALANGYQVGLSIDRIDTNGNYEPSNCRWANLKEQANNKTTNHILIYNGEAKTINEWAEFFNIKREIIKDRLRWGWDVSRIFETPVAKCEKIDYEFDGEVHSLKEWAKIKDIPYWTVWARIKKSGWSIDKALTTPVQSRKNTTK